MIETHTAVLRDDEPTYGMKVEETPAGFVTTLRIMRGGKIVQAQINHGHDEEYSGRVPPLFVPSVEGENPVGLMLQMSEEHRHDLRYWRYSEELRESSTLISDVLVQEEKALLQIRNASTLGPYVTVQRHGHSHEKVVREWMEERARRTKRRAFLT